MPHVSDTPRKESLAEGIDLWLGNCLDVLPLIGRVAHVISDPPYEQRSHDSSGSIRRADGQRNPEAIPFAGIDLQRSDLLKLVSQICDGWFIAFCTTEGVAAWRDEIERQNIKYKTPCIWVKPDAMPKFNGQGPSHGHECIVTAWCSKGYSVWNGGGRRGVFTHYVNPPDREGSHPTEKPLSLMRELISLFTKPGETICDPFMGSGSTGVAAISLGRKFIGIEREQAYFDLACRRVAKSLKQTDLFVEIPKPKQQELFK